MLPDVVPEPIQRRLADYASLLRIDRPIGTLLLLWPTYWALWLAGDGSPGLGNVIVFTLGVFFMRAAGCAINDFADRDWDKHVKRTKDRPRPPAGSNPGKRWRCSPACAWFPS